MAQDVGLTAKLKFMGDSAVAGMKRAGKQMSTMALTAKRMKAGFANVRQGMTGVATAGAGVGAMAGFTVKKFVDFDGQMGKVRAVLGEQWKKDWPMLEREAQRLGATTSFTATQAAEAMESLARAGKEPQEIMEAMRPLLAGAAADSLDLATAADIMNNNMAAFGLKAKDSTRIMDTLAYVSRNTKSNMTSLQEGLGYAADTAVDVGVSFEDTVAAIGALNDIGVESSRAGTAMANMMTQLSKKTKQGYIMIGKHRVAVETNEKGNLKLRDTMMNIVGVMGKFENKMAASAAVTEALGVRGKKVKAAFQALAGNDAKMKKLFTNLAEKAAGTAEAMEKIQLASLKGQFTILTSAIDGVVQGFGKAIFKGAGMGGVVESLTKTLSSAAKAFSYFSDNPLDLEKNNVQIEGVSRGIMDLVRGIVLGIRDVKETVSGVFDGIKSVARVFGIFGSDGAAGTARLITKMAGLAAAIAPVALALKGGTMLFGGFARAGFGAFQVIQGALTPFLKGAGGVLGKLGGRFKFLQKVLPKSIQGIAGAARVAEKAMAQPVRVVNFDEAGGLGGGIGRAGAGGLGPELAETTGRFARLRGGLTRLAGRVPRIGGMLTRSFGGITKGAGLFSKAALGPAGLVAAAGAAGYGIGTLIDRYTGASDKISEAMRNWARDRALERSAVHGKTVAAPGQALRMAQQFAKMSGDKVTEVGLGGGKKAALTRAFAEKRITKYLETQDLSKAEIVEVMKKLDKTLGQIKVNVNVDGRPIATAAAVSNNQSKERMGAQTPPRTRSKARAQGG